MDPFFLFLMQSVCSATLLLFIPDPRGKRKTREGRRKKSDKGRKKEMGSVRFRHSAVQAPEAETNERKKREKRRGNRSTLFVFYGDRRLRLQRDERKKREKRRGSRSSLSVFFGDRRL